MLKETAGQHGIDLDALDADEFEEEKRLIKEAAGDHKLCRAARVYNDMAENWFNGAKAFSVEGDAEKNDRSAHDFLALAESFLQKGTLFRCRDFARFAAVRAIKGLFVKHDIHPPRETDLVLLLNEAKQLEPDMVQHAAFVRELNGYCPAETDAGESRRMRSMVEGTAGFVSEIVANYGFD